MTSRHTRDERARFEAIAYGVQRTGSAINATYLLYIAGYAAAGAGIGYLVQPTPRAIVGGAGLGAFVGLMVFTAVLWSVLHDALGYRPVVTEDDGRFTQTGPRTLTRLPDGVTQSQYARYMRDVLDGETGFNQRDAAAYGYTRETFNALVEWVHGRGWYVYANGQDNRNGGEFVAPPAVILATTPADDDA